MPAQPAVNLPANPQLPSLFLIGDSTVRNGHGRGDGGQWGWGDFLAPFFDTNRINVVNRALGGTSSRTFYRDQWPRVAALLKPGDFVIMQFGHNDSQRPQRHQPRPRHHQRRRRRNPHHHKPDHQTDRDRPLLRLVRTHADAEARAKGATPMVCSLIPRNNWKNGRAVRNLNDYAGWAGQAAAAEHAPFLDINEIIARQYDALGPAAVKPLFIAGAGPHTSLAGAQTNALCVVAALKSLPNNPLAPFFSAQAEAIPPADLSRPAPAPAAPAPDKTEPE